jgi:hypothetical protein
MIAKTTMEEQLKTGGADVGSRVAGMEEAKVQGGGARLRRL